MKSKFQGFIGFLLSIIIAGISTDALAFIPPPWVWLR